MSASLGYIVLRKPEHNYDLQRRKGFRATAPHIMQIYYSGVDRMPWFDFDELHYQDSLPITEQELWESVKAQQAHSPLSELRAVRDLEAARSVMSVLKSESWRNEICRVSIGRFGEAVSDELCEGSNWLGVDIVVSGYGSTLVQGLYARPDLYRSFAAHLNGHGLFSVDSEVLVDYKKAIVTQNTDEHNLEVFPDAASLWYSVGIARV